MEDTRGRHDPVLKFLREMHKNISISEKLCRTVSNTPNISRPNRSNCFLRDWAIVGTNNGKRRNARSQNEMWSVYDYSLVWGKKHAYAAASITVT